MSMSMIMILKKSDQCPELGRFHSRRYMSLIKIQFKIVHLPSSLARIGRRTKLVD